MIIQRLFNDRKTETERELSYDRYCRTWGSPLLTLGGGEGGGGAAVSVHCSSLVCAQAEPVEEVICLVPELCSMTGLTDMARSDFRVMKVRAHSQTPVSTFLGFS